MYHAASLMIYQGILIPPISQVTQVQCMAKCMIVIEKEVIVCIDGITIFLLKNPPPRGGEYFIGYISLFGLYWVLSIVTRKLYSYYRK